MNDGPHLVEHEHIGFNGRLAIFITNAVGTMWCAYVFAVIALVSLPEAIRGGTAPLIAWIAQTFLQLVLLSVFMVGQKVAAAASDKQALQTYQDAEALIKIQDDVHRLVKLNANLTQEIHAMIADKGKASSLNSGSAADGQRGTQRPGRRQTEKGWRLTAPITI